MSVLKAQQTQQNKAQEIHMEDFLKEVQQYRELLKSQVYNKKTVCSDAQTAPLFIQEPFGIHTLSKKTELGFESKGVQAIEENIQPSKTTERSLPGWSLTLDGILRKHVLEVVKAVELILHNSAPKIQQVAQQPDEQKISDALKDNIKLAAKSSVDDKIPEIVEKVLRGMQEGAQLKQETQAQSQNRPYGGLGVELSSDSDGCSDAGLNMANLGHFGTSQESGFSRNWEAKEKKHPSRKMVDSAPKITPRNKSNLSLETAKHFLHLQQQLARDRRHVAFCSFYILSETRPFNRVTYL